MYPGNEVRDGAKFLLHPQLDHILHFLLCLHPIRTRFRARSRSRVREAEVCLQRTAQDDV